jgi:thioredoxin 1
LPRPNARRPVPPIVPVCTGQMRPRPADAIFTDVIRLQAPLLGNFMAIKYVTDATFEQDVVTSSTPVLVDYWAEWCGPCKMIAPILEEVDRDYSGRVQIAKVDVDANQDTAAKFGIRGIPTLMLFKNGAVVASKVGAVSKSQLTAFLDSHL